MNPDFFFTYTVDPNADEPIMLIDRHIGYDAEDGQGIDGALFQKELLVLDSMGKKRIQVWINSVGGVVLDGWNIFNAMLKTETKVDTYCIGMAASICGVIFQAGRKRIMNDYSILMYHNPFGGDEKSLDAIKDSLIKMIGNKSGMPLEDVEKMMKRTTYISADEALNMGLCDEIDQSIEFNKKRAISTDSEAKAYWKDANQVLNSITTPIKNSFDMKSIANKLSLNPEASEAGIVTEIDKIQNRNKELEAEKIALIKNKDSEIDAKQKECDSLKKKCEDAENALAQMKKQKEDDENAAAKAKADADEEMAKNTVLDYVKAGKIKNEPAVIAKATAIAVKDVAGFKELFGDLPINKVANKIEVTATATEGDKLKMVSVVANKMNKLRAAAAK